MCMFNYYYLMLKMQKRCSLVTEIRINTVCTLTEIYELSIELPVKLINSEEKMQVIVFVVVVLFTTLVGLTVKL